MPSPVSRIRRHTPVLCIASLAVVTALVAGSSHAQTAEAAASSEAFTKPPGFAFGADPFADRFPNVVLKTHEGRNVRFYDDLLKDKIVLINFMYASCTER